MFLEASRDWFRRARTTVKRATTDVVYVRSTFRSSTVECPTISKGATVVSLQDQASGSHTDVVRCSELHGDETCDCACLKQLKSVPKAT